MLFMRHVKKFLPDNPDIRLRSNSSQMFTQHTVTRHSLWALVTLCASIMVDESNTTDFYTKMYAYS